MENYIILLEDTEQALNQGHGNARRISLQSCNYELVALMDADDVSVPYRFGLQLQAFHDNKKLSIVGGQIAEFDETGFTGIRSVPCKHEKIKRYTQKRCPMNQMSVMFKRTDVAIAGGYQDWYCNEDYFLWIRMVRVGCLFANVPEILVNVRTGQDMAARRGGWRYFTSEAKLQLYMLRERVISLPRFLYNIILRFGGEVLLPTVIRKQAFRLFRERSEHYSQNLPQNLQKAASQIVTKKQEAIKTQNVTGIVEVAKIEDATKVQDVIKIGECESYPPFSVAMCVYEKDNPEWFDTALESIIVNQTVKPSEVVLVVDGPIPDTIQDVIDKYAQICARGGVAFKLIQLSENQGLGRALNVAVNNCNNELIARMDSDDIAISDRFEIQLNVLVRNKSECIDILGGQIEEFIDFPTNVIGKRIVPETDEAIKLFMKKRCPFNHMTVMFKKFAVLEAGNYQDWFWNEDYYLWIRMALKGQKFANVPETLVKVRVGKDMYARRGGDKYFRSEVGIQKFMLNNHIIGQRTFLMNYAKRFIVQKLLPNKARAWVFRSFAREC